MRNKIFSLSATFIVAFGSAHSAQSRGLDMTQESSRKLCAIYSTLVGEMAMQAAVSAVPANKTKLYDTLANDPKFSDFSSSAPVLAKFVEATRGKMKPELIGYFSMNAICLGMEEAWLFSIASDVGKKCNEIAKENEFECVNQFVSAADERRNK